MKKIVLCILCVVVIVAIVGLVSVNNKNNENVANENTKQESSSIVANNEERESVPKSEQTGTAGSNIPLKDNTEEAEYQIKVAMQYLLEETYGDKVFDARIYVEKIYTAEEEKEEPLKSLNIGINDVAFEVKYELKLVDGVDVNEFLAGSGEYDEESGWVKEKYNVGILRPNEDGEQKYKITNFGTGW